MTSLMARRPEPGQLVQVRGRLWVASEVERSEQPLDPFGPPDAAGQHLVRLISVEDDGFGDELSVIWEVEPGARGHSRATLPNVTVDGFDDPDRLDAFLDAVRWGAIATADARTLQAPFRSGVRIEDYQLDPVVRALREPRVNLLVADDVGLGKTIEAGLVIQELLLRHRARTVLVVCPASLCLKWEEEMAEKFGLRFEIIDAAAVRALRRDRGVAANIFGTFPRLIVSMDWVKRPRAMALLDEVLPADATQYPRRFDLLVVDEVHQCAPSGSGRYAMESQRTKAIRRLAPHFEHRLFLSATPHNGYTESFTTLLEMLDPQRFAKNVIPTEEAKRQVVVRRLKSQLNDLARSEGRLEPFAERVIVPLEVSYPADERRAHRLLVEYTELRLKQASNPASQTATGFVSLLLKKRLFSSPKALLNTLVEHRQTLSGRRHEIDERRIRRAFDRLDDEVADEDDLAEATRDALTTAGRATEPLTAEQAALLDQLQAWAERAVHQPDAKARILIDWLAATCRPNGVWNNERVILFTEYRDTQNWLAELLDRHDLGGDRLELLYGGMDNIRREDIKAKFQADPTQYLVRILLATDAASEGIDLQLQCHRLVHVETPFSPTRMEQRNGRVDRFLQPSPRVLIHHVVGAGYEQVPAGSIEADLEFLLRIARKVDTIRDDLGTAGPLLATQVEEAMLGRRRTIDDGPIENRSRISRAVLRMERDLRDEVGRLRSQLDETISELDLTPATVERVVRVALELAHQPPLLRDPKRPHTFEVQPLTGAWAGAMEGLHDRLSGRQRSITFDHAVADPNGSVVLAHLGHGLVERATRLLRAEVWSTAGQRRLNRVTARVTPGIDEVIAVAHTRLVVTGGDGHRLHEQLVTSGGWVRNDRFARIEAQRDVAAALAHAGHELAPKAVLAQLAGAWPRIAENLTQSLRVRASEVADQVERSLAARAEADDKSVTTVLTELHRSITRRLAELDADTPIQLSLFNPDERAEATCDIESLRRRIASIPEEIERERAAVRRRYADPTPRSFPAAVTFLVPERLAKAAAR